MVKAGVAGYQAIECFSPRVYDPDPTSAFMAFRRKASGLRKPDACTILSAEARRSCLAFTTR